ncbi:MAG: DUF3551 domain-containing protein [Pseudolabrys sp.]
MPLKTLARAVALPVLAAVITVSPQAVPTAQAGIEYPWCAIYSEASVGATNCGFSTLAQCRATISGIGGGCAENPAYVPPAYAPRKSLKRKPLTRKR